RRARGGDARADERGSHGGQHLANRKHGVHGNWTRTGSAVPRDSTRVALTTARNTVRRATSARAANSGIV
ncbi:hypothetical protein, partial [Burkholderia multivorans]|uniref:hypothetical protein n=1 Tax=Burkholderia multivorans TaxID=87883 RepID=UPI0002781138